MDYMFESLLKLFVDRMLKWMNSHVQIVDQLSKVNVCNKDNQQIEECIMQETT